MIPRSAEKMGQSAKWYRKIFPLELEDCLFLQEKKGQVRQLRPNFLIFPDKTWRENPYLHSQGGLWDNLKHAKSLALLCVEFSGQRRCQHGPNSPIQLPEGPVSPRCFPRVWGKEKYGKTPTWVQNKHTHFWNHVAKIYNWFPLSMYLALSSHCLCHM